MATQDPIESLVEQREAKMVAFNGSPQKPIFRKALFLKPTCSNPTNFDPPFVSNSLQTPNLHLGFKWWADPLFSWPLWVDKLTPKCTTLWKRSGIFDAIMASKYKVRSDPSSLLGVSRFWSEETHSFIFPWGEATLTLEDVMVLGGFSVLGEPVRVSDPMRGHMGFNMRCKFEELKKLHGRVEHCVWMDSYMKGGLGGEIEHVAFLSLWLSKFVFADSDGRGIRDCVFQIAVRLAKGVRIALAPAVLASVYCDIGVMKNYVLGGSSVLAISAPVNLLQLWIWERFSALRLGSKNTYIDRPIAGRWNFSEKRFDSVYVMSIFKSPNEFKWRPYSSANMENGEWFCSSETEDEGLQSFARCVRACELVGLDCIVQYLPHRVAMQFGFDQEVPSSLPHVDYTWELAWETYDISSKSVKFFVPLRLSKGDVTVEYSDWWKGAGKNKKTGELTSPNIDKKNVTLAHSNWWKEVRNKRKGGEDTLPDTSKKKVKSPSSETGETMKMNLKVEEEEEERLILDEFITEGSEGENKVEEALEESYPVRKKELEIDVEITETGETVIEMSKVDEEERQILDEFGVEEFEAEKKVEREFEESCNPVRKTGTKIEDEITGTRETVTEKSKIEEVEEVEKRRILDKFGVEEFEADNKVEELKERNPVRKNVLEIDEQMTETGDSVIEKSKEEKPQSLDELGVKEFEAENKVEEEIEERNPVKKKELEIDLKIIKLRKEIASIRAKITYLESLPESELSSTA